MRQQLKKWGEFALAAACVAAILFAALYTRQEDLRRLAAHPSAASEDERLGSPSPAPAWQLPVEGQVLQPFAGARRTAGGWWQLSPDVLLQAAPGQSARAMGEGVVLLAEAGCVRLRHGDGTHTLYAGLDALRVRPGESVAAGQALGAISREGCLRLSALREGVWIDPLSLAAR